MFYDAEHFFDGYKTNPDYALETIRHAVAAGAERVILCDTNGGSMPWEVKDICQVVRRECSVPLGIHAHNDCEMAVANSLVAIETGVVQVQGTINGIGERCGNANLCSIIPNLELKMKRPVLERPFEPSQTGVRIRHRDREPHAQYASALCGRFSVCP